MIKRIETIMKKCKDKKCNRREFHSIIANGNKEVNTVCWACGKITKYTGGKKK